MNKIDDMFDRLQGQMPELENPEEMVESIMRNLPDREMPLPVKASKQYAVLIALRIISSAAAIWLIGLFIYVNQPLESDAQHVNVYMTDFPKSGTLETVYTRRLQAGQSKPISYTQFKQMIYAKK